MLEAAYTPPNCGKYLNTRSYLSTPGILMVAQQMRRGGILNCRNFNIDMGFVILYGSGYSPPVLKTTFQLIQLNQLNQLILY